MTQAATQTVAPAAAQKNGAAGRSERVIKAARAELDAPKRRITSIESLVGVGPQLAAALRSRFKTYAAVFAALERLDFETLGAVPGVSDRRALEWMRQVRGLDGGEKFFGTPNARRLFDDVMERILSFASTAPGRNRLRLLAPLADAEAAARAAQGVMLHKKNVADLDRDAVRRQLRKIRRPIEPAPRQTTDRIVIALDARDEERLMELGVPGWAAVGGRSDLERLEPELLAVVLGDAGETADNVVEVAEDAGLADLAPERTLAWFESNRDVISACGELARLLGRPTATHEVHTAFKEQPVAVATGNIATIVADVRQELDVLLKSKVAGVNVTGMEALEAWADKIPPTLRAAVDDVLRHGRDRLRERTGIAFQPFVAAFPIGVDDNEVEQVTSSIETRALVTTFEARRALATRLEPLRGAIEAEVSHWLAFDADFALGCFALHHDLAPARFGGELRFTASLHLDLAGRADAQPVSYHLGGDANVALLTGANSGGKTTLLEQIGQTVLLARLGLPVPGRDVTVPWVDELHYVTARRSLDAGAFETFLRTFLPLAGGDAARLILADEVEAITEPDAAGRILAFFCDRAARNPRGLAILVSHMAPQVLRHTTAPVRVDGIEATGLDGEGHLVVDRTPRMGQLARSTPELIIQRLASQGRNGERALFADLLATFHSWPPQKGTTSPRRSASS